jgi:uncharacterized protein
LWWLHSIAASSPPLSHDDGSWTPLFFAASEGHEQVTSLLLSLGAGVDIRNILGSNALMRAAFAGHLGVARALLSHPRGGAYEVVNAQNIKGRTALWYAAREGRADMIRLLLKHGAEMRIADAEEMDALAVARSRGQDSCVQVLEVSHAKR